ncbi:hypothetical protein EJ06DRAFT_412481 [Trichodelitschia bisporula]|uniref:Uncharacterized protein n=1 Tax=Trichodelitschia bisporula TaxID=703511 RepID=A0A6G1HYG4_9PEZI|nr:hypothetical protein EJ06DRAFT_412481 [Trichodelitschia bisporula]
MRRAPCAARVARPSLERLPNRGIRIAALTITGSDSVRYEMIVLPRSDGMRFYGPQIPELS